MNNTIRYSSIIGVFTLGSLLGGCFIDSDGESNLITLPEAPHYMPIFQDGDALEYDISGTWTVNAVPDETLSGTLTREWRAPDLAVQDPFTEEFVGGDDLLKETTTLELVNYGTYVSERYITQDQSRDVQTDAPGPEYGSIFLHAIGNKNPTTPQFFWVNDESQTADIAALAKQKVFNSPIVLDQNIPQLYSFSLADNCNDTKTLCTNFIRVYDETNYYRFTNLEGIRTVFGRFQTLVLVYQSLFTLPGSLANTSHDIDLDEIDTRLACLANPSNGHGDIHVNPRVGVVFMVVSCGSAGTGTSFTMVMSLTDVRGNLANNI